ncbi:MAG: hypothetical protein ACXWCU_08795 [Caldimonas sp.]
MTASTMDCRPGDASAPSSADWHARVRLLRCTISGMDTALQRTIGEGSLFINYLTLDGPPTPLDRMVIGSGTTTIPALTETIACPGKTAETVTQDIPARWLSLPAEGVSISANGQTISGTWVRTDSEGTKTSVWNFKSVPD